MTGDIRLTIALNDYEHVRDFRLGEIHAPGIRPIWLIMDFHEIFARFLANREWEVSELSFAKFIAEATRPDPKITGIPVFLRQSFRFSFIFVNRKKGIKDPKDLRGRKIGIPEWAQTANLYTRGWLQDEIGTPLTEIDWYQAGTDEAGRDEKVEVQLPAGLRLTSVRNRTLNDMLVSGELDCVMAATPSRSFGTHPDVVRLFPDSRAVDESYHARTGVYPITHILAIRKPILQQHPWIARNLYNAFNQAKQRSQKRILRGLDFPVPWLAEHAALMQQKFGADFFPHGIEENRPTLELFLRYAYEQGIAHKRVRPKEIFPEGIMILAKN